MRAVAVGWAGEKLCLGSGEGAGEMPSKLGPYFANSAFGCNV